jgi:hypothetical protein
MEQLWSNGGAKGRKRSAPAARENGGDDARIPRRSRSRQQGPALPGRSAEGRRDHRRHARFRRRGARPSPSRTDRDHVASRVAHPGGSGSDRGRSRSTPRRSAGAARAGVVARSAWTYGDGSSSSPGLTCGARCRSVRCCASSTARRADGTGRLLRHAPSCGAPPARQECGVASRHISSGTPTP